MSDLPECGPDDSDGRWAVHRVWWDASVKKQVRMCRRYAHDADAETLPLRFSPREDGGVDVGVGGTSVCSSWHSCLICSAKIAVHRARELEHVFKICRKLGFGVVVATFTCRSDRSMPLRKLVEGQRAGWAEVRSDRPWKEDLAALGVVRFDRPDSDRKVNGIIRAFECTVGDEFGWHPHFHVFFLVDHRITQAEAFAALLPAWDRWCGGLAEHGLTAVLEAVNPKTGKLEPAGFDVTVMDDADAGKLARYPFKLALEAVGGVFKRGRSVDKDGNVVGKRHRTPFEVMESYAVAAAQAEEGNTYDKLAQQDWAIVKEWTETASDMRFKQCPLPPGLRAVFQKLAADLGIPGPLLEGEKSDEEIAEAEVEGSQTAGDIDSGEWSTQIAYELDTLRAAGREGGLTAVCQWFDQRDLVLNLTATGVERVVYELEHLPPRARARDG